MNKPDITLTKICSNCGQRKPLSAFMQQVGSHSYGNICSACRKTVLENPPKDTEESTRSTTGLKIDAKTKVKDAADKREALKQIEESYIDEREKQEEKQFERVQKVGHVADSEKTSQKFSGKAFISG